MGDERTWILAGNTGVGSNLESRAVGLCGERQAAFSRVIMGWVNRVRVNSRLLSRCRSQIFRFLLFPEIPCCCRTLEGWTGVKVPVSLCSGVSSCRMRRSLGLPRHWVCVLTHIQPRCVVTTPKLGRFAIRSSLLRPLRQTGNNLQKSLLVYPKWDAELRDFRMLHN